MGTPQKKNEKQQRLSYPLQQAISDYIKDNVSSGNWLPKTEQGNKEKLRMLVNHFGTYATIDELSGEKLQSWLTQKDVKPVTKRSYARDINPFLKWLHENGFSDQQWNIKPTRLEKQEIRNTDKIKYITYDELKNMERGYRWQVQANKDAGFLSKDFNPDKHPDAWFFMFCKH